MTRDEIENILKESEINALIAQKIFGLPVIELKDANCPYCGDEMRFCGERSRCVACNEWRYSPYKNYTDDIAAAWEVVEFLRRKFWSTNIVCWDYSERWVVTCEYRTGHGEPKKTLYADAETAPLAICRAALLAVMSE
jgi:hypothetical protein